MNTLSKIITFILVAICFLSCKKDDQNLNTNTNNNNTDSTQSIGFYYAENNNTTYSKADEAIANKQYKTIIAKNNNATIVEFVVTDFAIGTYPLTARYAFTYVKDNKHWEATNGTLVITKNDGNKISGTYEATDRSGVDNITSVNGYFNDVTIQ